MSDLKPISESTPITVGIFLVLMTTIFLAGMGWQRLADVESGHEDHSELLEKLSILTADNKARLDLLEYQIRYNARVYPAPPTSTEHE